MSAKKVIAREAYSVAEVAGISGIPGRCVRVGALS